MDFEPYKVNATVEGFQCPECKDAYFWNDVLEGIELGDEPDVVRCGACDALIEVSSIVFYTVLEPAKDM